MSRNSIKGGEERTPLLGESELEQWNKWKKSLCIFSVACILSAVVSILGTYVTWNHKMDTRSRLGYDFIIVGAGPAGSVLARLLSDNKKFKVLLIEAGPTTQADLGGQDFVQGSSLTFFDVPYMWTKAAVLKGYRWPYANLLAGKNLGGSGTHNAMLYVRALPLDIESWDAPEWQWNDMLELYKLSENYTGPSQHFHGTEGAIKTVRAPHVDAIAVAWLKAARQAGLPLSDDFNDVPHGRNGAGIYQFNIRDGIRDSAAKAYLSDVIGKRSNLEVQLMTEVKRVTLENGIAIGVDLKSQGDMARRVNLKEGGEVIITAGALNTPKVLLQSGIGSTEQLAQIGVKPKVVSAGVGKNLQDHPAVALTFEIQPSFDANFSKTDEDAFRHYANCVAAGTHDNCGIFESPGISAGAFLIPPGSTKPELQITVFSRKSEPHIVEREGSDLHEVLVTVALLTPQARNKIELRPTSPDNIEIMVVPDISNTDEGHLPEIDLRKLIWGIRVVRDTMQQPAMRKIVGKEASPGANIIDDEALMQWARSSTLSNSHWVGTSRLGKEQQGAVVDGRLRVYGVEGLRVADASVIPNVPNGNVHSTVVVVAQNAARMILEDHSDPLANGR